MAKNWKQFIKKEEAQAPQEQGLGVLLAPAAANAGLPAAALNDEIKGLIRERQELEQTMQGLVSPPAVPAAEKKYSSKIPGPAQLKQEENAWLKKRRSALEQALRKKTATATAGTTPRAEPRQKKKQEDASRPILVKTANPGSVTEPVRKKKQAAEQTVFNRRDKPIVKTVPAFKRPQKEPGLKDEAFKRRKPSRKDLWDNPATRSGKKEAGERQGFSLKDLAERKPAAPRGLDAWKERLKTGVSQQLERIIPAKRTEALQRRLKKVDAFAGKAVKKLSELDKAYKDLDSQVRAAREKSAAMDAEDGFESDDGMDDLYEKLDAVKKNKTVSQLSKRWEDYNDSKKEGLSAKKSYERKIEGALSTALPAIGQKLEQLKELAAGRRLSGKKEQEKEEAQRQGLKEGLLKEKETEKKEEQRKQEKKEDRDRKKEAEKKEEARREKRKEKQRA